MKCSVCGEEFGPGAHMIGYWVNSMPACKGCYEAANNAARKRVEIEAYFKRQADRMVDAMEDQIFGVSGDRVPNSAMVSTPFEFSGSGLAEMQWSNADEDSAINQHRHEVIGMIKDAKEASEKLKGTPLAAMQQADAAQLQPKPHHVKPGETIPAGTLKAGDHIVVSGRVTMKARDLGCTDLQRELVEASTLNERVEALVQEIVANPYCKLPDPVRRVHMPPMRDKRDCYTNIVFHPGHGFPEFVKWSVERQAWYDASEKDSCGGAVGSGELPGKARTLHAEPPQDKSYVPAGNKHRPSACVVGKNHTGTPSSAPAIPAGLVRYAIRPKSGAGAADRTAAAGKSPATENKEGPAPELIPNQPPAESTLADMEKRQHKLHQDFDLEASRRCRQIFIDAKIPAKLYLTSVDGKMFANIKLHINWPHSSDDAQLETDRLVALSRKFVDLVKSMEKPKE